MNYPEYLRQHLPIASGVVEAACKTLQQVLDLVCPAAAEGGADAVLAASIFHYREHTVREAKEYLRRRGVVVRPHFAA